MLYTILHHLILYGGAPVVLLIASIALVNQLMGICTCKGRLNGKWYCYFTVYKV